MSSIAEILVGIGLLTLIVWLLTLLIIATRLRLMPRGTVVLRINDTLERSVPAGGKLHEALASVDILLPNACGGKGTCGQCRIQVMKGGGELLPTEAAQVTRREAREGYRLACQVPVLDNLSLIIPVEMLETRQWQCTVRSNDNVATFIKELVLDLPPGETLDFRAGGYVQIEAPPHRLRYADFDIGSQYRNDWERFGLFKLESSSGETVSRAYSMANCPAENHIVMLNVRIATPPSASDRVPPGIVSSWIFNLKPGDSVKIYGPFGNFFHQDTTAEMVYVGGGAGMAPMRSHILDLLGRLASQRRISFWYGARSLREAFYVEEFERLAEKHSNFSFHLALSEPLPEDEWTGATGFIHDVLYEHYLRPHPAPEDCEYYLCGPPVMIAAVNRMLYELGVEEENILFDDFGV